jgi:glycosyltransferase EpsD
MKKKVLFVATVDRGHILKFHIPYLQYFKEKGFEVHVACAGDADIPFCDQRHKLPFQQSPFKFSNIQAYLGLKKIIDANDYSLIHCHTPMGAVIGRLAARAARKKGTKVLYTAHGFHFFKGASVLNWLIYYPVEKLLSLYTDCLITINQEDYQNALKKHFFAKSIRLVKGVGVDLTKFSPSTTLEKRELRKEYQFDDDQFLIMYTADLNHNKHQDLLIHSMSSLKKTIPNIKLLLAGEGPLLDDYRKLVQELDLNEVVHFLGFRKDIQNLLKISDIAVSASRREGLPVNIMEAMAAGLPLVVTDSRGNRDMVQNGENGFVVGIDDVSGFSESVQKLYDSKQLREAFGARNLDMVKQYSLDSIVNNMAEIYSDYI